MNDKKLGVLATNSEVVFGGWADVGKLLFPLV